MRCIILSCGHCIIFKEICICYRVCLTFPLFVAVFSVVWSENSRPFLICCGREEQLRFNLQNFWFEGVYEEGLLTNLPRLHILLLLYQILSKEIMNFISLEKKIMFSVYGHFLLVPAGYTMILLFLWKQNKRVAGSVLT